MRVNGEPLISRDAIDYHAPGLTKSHQVLGNTQELLFLSELRRIAIGHSRHYQSLVVTC